METGRMSCAVNAFTGREEELDLSPVARAKRAGESPGSAGESCYVARSRSHEEPADGEQAGVRDLAHVLRNSFEPNVLFVFSLTNLFTFSQ